MKRTLCAAACLAMLLASCRASDYPNCSRQLFNPFASCPSPSQPSSDTADEGEPDAATIGRAERRRAMIGRQADAVRRLVGGSPPVETAAQQDRRAQQLVPRSDSRIDTATYIDFHRADLQDFSSSVRCSGSSCTHTFPDGETITLDLSSSTFAVGTTLLTRNGITIELVNNAFVDDNDRSIHVENTWSNLYNSGFGSGYQYRAETADSYGDSVRYSTAYGDSTGSAPSVGATWRGMATAVNKQNDDLLLGDAELRYAVSATGGSLEATLGAFVNVTEARATTPLAIFFDDIQVRSDGTFNFVTPNRKIQGAFYGNAHAEAAGVFEHSIPDGSGNLLDLLGAFGTKHQSQLGTQTAGIDAARLAEIEREIERLERDGSDYAELGRLIREQTLIRRRIYEGQ